MSVERAKAPCQIELLGVVKLRKGTKNALPCNARCPLSRSIVNRHTLCQHYVSTVLHPVGDSQLQVMVLTTTQNFQAYRTEWGPDGAPTGFLKPAT